MRPSDKEFVSESEQILEEAVDLLLDMQEAPRGKIRPDSLNALFRCMHTIKGLAGLYGYGGLSDMCHALESILDDLRLGKADMSEDVLAFLITSVDVLKSLFDEIKAGDAGKESDVSDSLKRIELFRNSLKRKRGVKRSLEGIIDRKILKVVSEYEEHRLMAGLEDGKGIYAVVLVFSLKDFDTRLRKISDRIKTIGELICTLPISEGIPRGSIGFKLVFSGTRSAAEMKREIKAGQGSSAPGIGLSGSCIRHRKG
jgi:two-component system chemotaxis sensor kinase CheA